MAKKFLTGLTLVNLDSDPLVGSEGELYFNSSASVAKIYKAGSWSVIGEGAGGGGVSISETAPTSPNTGDLWYQASTGSFSVWDGTYWVEINTVIGGGSGAGIIVSTTAPEDPETGTGWYNNETGVLAVWDGTYWVDVNGVIENDPVTQEQIQDYVAPLLDHANHVNISATYDDSNNQIILSASASGGTGTGVTISETAPEDPQIGDGWYNNASGAFYLYDGSYWVEVNGIVTITPEQVQDYVSPLFIHNNHTNVTATYDDANGEIILNTSASITNIDSIVYPDYITFDTSPETTSAAAGTVFWDSGDGLAKAVLNANVELGIGQESVALVKNATGSTISKGKVVYINGAQGQRPTIALASSTSEATSSKTFGFTAEPIADGVEGFVVTEGILRGINTGGLTQGGAVWLSSSGNYTQTMPTQPNHGVFLGYVVKANSSSGEIFVKIQNGYELEELHNVLISASVQNNDLLMYESSSELWKNKPISDIINDSINPFLLMGG